MICHSKDLLFPLPECEICGQEMLNEDYEFSDICPDCLEGI